MSLWKKKSGDTDKQGRKPYEGAEIEGDDLQTKEHQGLPATTRI